MDHKNYPPIQLPEGYVEDEATTASEEAFNKSNPLDQRPTVEGSLHTGNISLTGVDVPPRIRESRDAGLLGVKLEDGTFLPMRPDHGSPELTTKPNVFHKTTTEIPINTTNLGPKPPGISSPGEVGTIPSDPEHEHTPTTSVQPPRTTLPTSPANTEVPTTNPESTHTQHD